MKLTKEQTTLLRDTLSVITSTHNEQPMIEYIVDFCTRYGIEYRVDEHDNVYVKKGSAETYPCIVAHTDTVHAYDNGLTICRYKDYFYGMNNLCKQEGTGGDDKVGIFIALQLLIELDCCKAAFFVAEEIGCVGSGKADIEFFKDCRYVMQCDRRGNTDVVDNISGTKLMDDSFKKALRPIMKDHKLKFSSGMMSDVMALKELGIEAAMFNMSCGYYHPHTCAEYVSITDVGNTLSFCREVAQLQQSFTCKYVASSYGHYGYLRGWDDYEYARSTPSKQSTSNYNTWFPPTRQIVDGRARLVSSCKNIHHSLYDGYAIHNSGTVVYKYCSVCDIDWQRGKLGTCVYCNSSVFAIKGSLIDSEGHCMGCKGHLSKHEIDVGS